MASQQVYKHLNQKTSHSLVFNDKNKVSNPPNIGSGGKETGWHRILLLCASEPHSSQRVGLLACQCRVLGSHETSAVWSLICARDSVFYLTYIFKTIYRNTKY